MAQVNMCRHLGQRGKQLIHILKRHLKMVKLVQLCYVHFPFLFLNCSVSHLFVNLSAPLPSQATARFQSSSCLIEPGCGVRMDSSSMLRSSTPNAAMSSWAQNSTLPVDASLNASHVMKGSFPDQLMLLLLMF